MQPSPQLPRRTTIRSRPGICLSSRFEIQRLIFSRVRDLQPQDFIQVIVIEFGAQLGDALLDLGEVA